jgi:hypothetical protein
LADNMTDGNAEDSSTSSYAMSLANESYGWYKTAAIRSRKAYRISEAGVLIISASIPVAATISPRSAIAPAVLGAIVVVVSGLRTLFHWQDNYLRFSRAREAIEAERRLYYIKADPYDDLATRERNLAAAVSRIEQEEMAVWTRVAQQQTKS